MLVSDLLRYRDDLQKTLDYFDLSSVMVEINNQFQRIATTYPQFPGEQKLINSKINFEKISSDSVNYKENLATILFEIDNKIDELAKSAFDEKIDFHRTTFDTGDHVVNTVTANIHHSANFHYPALQLGCHPHSKRFTGELVANDPLYIYDAKEENILNIIDQFNEIYSRRIRKYTDLSILPYNQFGFIFSWMAFNYIKYSDVQEYLKKTIMLLRPGGKFLFSYNNCDLVENCQLAENYSMSYISKRHILKFCESAGYEIVDSYDLPNDDSHVRYISCIEIKKPGELTTIKRKQVMGAIHQK